MGLVRRLREDRAEYLRRYWAMREHVTESPVQLGPDDEPLLTDQGTLWRHVEDEDVYETARAAVDEMPWWSKW